MIPQRNLSLLSNRLARKGGRRIPEAVLERDYCISWFLVGFSETPLIDFLAFKGGTAIKKCYIPDYRFSEDLDFTLREAVLLKRYRRILPSPLKTLRRPPESRFKSAAMIGIPMRTVTHFSSPMKALYREAR